MLKKKIESLVKSSIAKGIQEGALGELQNIPDTVPLDFTKNPEHGDRAISVAMKLAKEAKMSPRNIAAAIAEHLPKTMFQKVDIAGPGFINLTLDWNLLEEIISDIHCQDNNYGKLTSEERPDLSYKKVLLEYVSANPTGDLHLGHGRGAVLGSALVELLKWAGYEVDSEFYINDAGVQMQKLGNSLWQALQIKQAKIETSAYEEENYPLEAMNELIDKLSSSLDTKEDLDITACSEIAKQYYLKEQKAILEKARVFFDKWYSEKEEIHEQGKIEEVCKLLKEKDFSYEKDSALWFKAKDFGDERDRVLKKSDGTYTYLMGDLAYHQDKFKRAERLVNLWGADHHGQIPGIKGALNAIGEDGDKLEVLLMQLVSLTKAGEEVKMSKRSGNFVTVNDLIEEVGVDAFRYFLLDSQANNRLVFDLELASKQDKDNPVYYIQYAHARCCSIFRNLSEPQIDQEKQTMQDSLFTKAEINTCLEDMKSGNLNFNAVFANLNPEELRSTKDLILLLSLFPEEIKDAALARAPYKIAGYLKNLASAFHQFYTHNRVITDDKDLVKARLALVLATQKTLRNALNLLQVHAPERM